MKALPTAELISSAYDGSHWSPTTVVTNSRTVSRDIGLDDQIRRQPRAVPSLPQRNLALLFRIASLRLGDVRNIADAQPRQRIDLGACRTALRVALLEHVASDEIAAGASFRRPHRIARLPGDEPKISGHAGAQREWTRRRQAAHGQWRQGGLSAFDHRHGANDSRRVHTEAKEQLSENGSRVANERRRPDMVDPGSDEPAEPWRRPLGNPLRRRPHYAGLQ